MTPSERPPPPHPSDHDHEDEGPDAPHSRDGREGPSREPTARRIVERLLREGVRRAVEKGVEQISETPENLRQFVHDLKLPREVASVLFQQIDETKNGLYRAVAREIRDFLGETNLAEELIKALTTLSFEIKTEIRFIPNDQRFDAGGEKGGEKAGDKPADKSGEKSADRGSDKPGDRAPLDKGSGRVDLKAVRPDVKATVKVHGLRDKEGPREGEE
ncbi:MAG: hypothetical protein EOO75_06580 [Myxococcales bacterium]|nr:MAG: hypothetical protein EOO75_06580 [Myxococcales bacterium]